MANKHISEDEIKYIVDVESSKAQKEIYLLEQQSKKLRSENKARLAQLIQLEAAGKKETDTYKNLKKQYTETGKEIKNLTNKIGEQTSKLSVLDMTMVQLKKQQKSLQRELDNTSKSLNPDVYDRLQSKLGEVNDRITELRVSAKSLKEIAKSSEFLGMVGANFVTKFGEFTGGFLKKLKDSVADLAKEGIKMAEQADGVTKAFKDLDNENLLANLRKATKGTVNDVQLMTAAVQAKDFRIPLEDLGKYLQFAQLKAQQTGQSVDYMTNSIVTGLGRKSPMILDNLGISAAEISEKTKETGDFMKAVAEIVDNQLAAAGETYISAADRAAQATAKLQNKQRELGEGLLPFKEAVDEAYGELQLKVIDAISWLLKNDGVVKTISITMAAFTVATLAARAAIVAHSVATKEATIWGKAWNVVTATSSSLLKALQAALLLCTGQVQKAKVAWAALNTTMKASVFGLVAAGIALVAVKLYDMHQKQTASARSAKELSDMEASVSRQVREERNHIKRLNDTMRDEHTSLARRQEALNQLKQIIPGYNGLLSKEGKLTRDNKNAIDQYNLSLEKSIKLRAYQDKLEELYKRQADQEDAEDRARKAKAKAQGKLNTANSLNAYNHSQGKLGTSGMNMLSSGMDIGTKQAQDELSKANNALSEAVSNLSVTNSEIARLEGRIKKLDIPTPKGGGGGGGTTTHTGTTHTGTTHTGTTNTTNKPNPDDIAQKTFSENRQAEIDAANQSYQQDVNNWNMALAQKQTTQEKYDIAMQALKTQHTANILAIETSYAEQSQDINIKDAAKKKSLQESQQKNLQAAEQKHFDQQVEAENAYQDALAKVMEQGEVKQQLSLKEEKEQKMQILKGYYDTALQLAQANGSDVFQLQKAYLNAQEQIEKEYHEKELAEQKEADEKKKQARQSLGFDQQSEYDQQLAQLKQALDNQYITQEEYEKKVQELKKNSFMKQAQYYTELFSGAVTALQNAEMSNVDAKYDAEIKAAESNTELQEKLEKKKANEKLKIQKKYADVNFAMQAAQIIANTATSIMKAYADMGPIAGSIAAALMSVTGTAQLVVANAERQKVKRMTLSNTGSSSSAGTRVASGRERGGRIDVQREQDGKHFNAEYAPDKRGYIDHPTVIVGEGPTGKSKEWVASNAALENPTVAPLIGILDQVQRAGNIRTFDMGKYLMAMQGRAMGGSVDDDSDINSLRTRSVSAPYQVRDSARFTSLATPTTQNSEANGAGSQVMEEMLSLLRNLRENGIPAFVALSELEQKQQLQEQSRKFAKK